MRSFGLFPWALAILFVGSVVWATSFGTLPPADFTFANNTEIKSVDPAIVTGQPEGRVVYALFEGLTGYDPKDLSPTPGVAERWEISPDGKTYRFYLRPAAKWSDGSPVLAEDFVWSWKRVLHPETASEYFYHLSHLTNAARFNSGKVVVGDPVEIELNPRRFPNQPFPQGILIRGKLLSIEGEGEGAVYEVDVYGTKRKFAAAPAEGKTLPKDVEPFRKILFDFEHVGVKALEPRLLEVKLNNPTPFFLKVTSFYTLFPVHRKSVEEFGAPGWTRAENLTVNGPFTMEFRLLRDRIRLRKNPQYWNAAEVKLNSVDVMAVASELTSLNLYLAGKIDWTPQVPASVLDALRQRTDYSATPRLSVYFFRLNTKRKPLDDPRVRRALAMAMDKKSVTLVPGAGEIPALYLVPPGIAGYASPHGVEFDPAAAKKLLAEAGYSEGKGIPPLEILYNTNDSHRDIAAVVQSQWSRNLGIDTRLRNMEWSSYLDTCQKQKYEIARGGWIGDYVDPNTFLDMFMTGNPNNQTGWSNPKFDELVRSAATVADPAERFARLAEAEKILLDEMPIIPVYFQVTSRLLRPYVHGIYDNLLEVHPLNKVEIDFGRKRELLAR